MGDPVPPPARPSWVRPLPIALGVAAVALSAVATLAERDRPLNVAAFGAAGLFVAARAGLAPALVVSLGGKLLADALLWWKYGFDTQHVPAPSVYVGFALYSVIGYLFLRRTGSAGKIGAAALGASILFFVVTNFVSWVRQDDPYGYTPAGLWDCYVAAVPFYRGTLTGDLVGTAVLFGLHAVLAKSTAPAAVAEEAAS